MIYEDYRERSYIPELDGLRALAILLVVSWHARDHAWDWLVGGYGVTVFFILSGYLITLLALREERSRGQLHIPSFFVRRVFRLFPLYYFVLGLHCLLIFGAGVAPEKRPGLALALPYYLCYFQEYVAFIGAKEWPLEGGGLPFSQSWSLGIEEKFYLVWPFLGFVAWRCGGATRRAGTAALAVLMALAPAALGARAGPFFSPYAQILVGCLAALLLDDPAWYARLAWLGRPGVGGALLASLLGLQVATGFFAEHDVGYRVCTSAYTPVAALFMVAILLGAGPIPRALRRPGLVLIGKLSYGIYLVHLLVMNAAEKIFRPVEGGNILVSLAFLAFASALSVASAYLLSVVLERPGIAMGRRISAALVRRGAGATPTPDPEPATG